MKSLFLAGLVCGLSSLALAADPKPISVAPGDEFKITLPSNMSTGYQWQLAKPVDEALLKMVSKEYKESETRRVGAAGEQVWTFKAVAPSSNQIEFHYLRPWEKDTPPARTTNFVVVIEKPVEKKQEEKKQEAK